MKLFLLPFLLGSLVAVDVQAQSQAQTPPRYSLGIGLEKMGLDGPDDIGTRYLLSLGRHWHHDRVVVTANLGYGWADNHRPLPFSNAYVEGKRRERVMLDMTASFDLIKHPRHAFRVGAGPSLWYRRDEQLMFAPSMIDAQGQLTRRLYWQPVTELNPGLNALVEYEFALTNRLLLRVNTKFADIRAAGPSTLYGGGIAYRLR